MFRHQSYYDVLTGLPNRLLLQQQLALALAESQQGDGCLNLLLLDLDRFKKINESLGHTTGDRLLQKVVSRLGTILAPGDIWGRWGGDEFTFIFTTLPPDYSVETLAQQILDTISIPFEFADEFPHLDSNHLYLQGSIGIASAPGDGQDSGTLLKHADAALYVAKQRGNSYETYSAAIGAQAVQRLRLENILHRAVDRQQFLLHYQPQIDFMTGRIEGVEALLRCSDGSSLWLSPLEFIPIAEDTGLINQIGEWALNAACHQNRQWQRQGLGYFPIAVNLSVKQLHQPDFIQTVHLALASSGLDPQYLEVEITESIAIANLANTIQVLQVLRGWGVKVALDDFGTGYSSLLALKHLPLDRLKVDREFIQELQPGSIDEGIVRTIISLGGELRLQTIAEGVETPAQLEFLRSTPCHIAQGYLFSRPLPPGELGAMIKAGVWCPA